jgi:hypothetical protein
MNSAQPVKTAGQAKTLALVINDLPERRKNKMEIIDTTGAKYPMRAIKFSEEEKKEKLAAFISAQTQEEKDKAGADLPINIDGLLACLVVDGLDELLGGDFNVADAIEKEGLNWIDVLVARYRMHEFDYWLEASTQFKGL